MKKWLLVVGLAIVLAIVATLTLKSWKNKKVETAHSVLPVPTDELGKVYAMDPKSEDVCGWYTKYALVRESGVGKEGTSGELDNLASESARGLAVSLTGYLQKNVLPPQVCPFKHTFLLPGSPAEADWLDRWGNANLTLSRMPDVAYRIHLLKEEFPILATDNQIAGFPALQKVVIPFGREFGPQFARTWRGQDKGQWKQASRVLYELVFDWKIAPAVLGIGEGEARRLGQLKSEEDRRIAIAAQLTATQRSQ